MAVTASAVSRLAAGALVLVAAALLISALSAHRGKDGERAEADGNSSTRGTVFERPEERVARGKNGAVASDSAICSELGVAVLRGDHSGGLRGSAADAAVTVALCLGVVHAHSSGIGGGCAAVHYDHPRKSFTMFDGRETAPAAAHRDMYNANGAESMIGPKSVAVPGELHALYALWSTHGRLRWFDIVQPVAELCLKGFELDAESARVIEHFLALNILHPTWLEHWYNPLRAQVGDRPLQTGDRVKFEKLGSTLRTIATDGIAAFYLGSIGDAMVADLTRLGGIMTRNDLRNYTHKMRRPTEMPFHVDSRRLSITGANLPFAGGLILGLMAGIVDAADVLQGLPKPYAYSDIPVAAELSAAQSMHFIVEASKYAYAHRMGLGDVEFVPNAGVVANAMLNLTHARELRKKIRPMQAFPSASNYAAREVGNLRSVNPDHGTTHFSIVDDVGSCVSLTSTVNLYYGSTVVSERTGILLNDQMDDFSKPAESNAFGYPPTEANFIAPGKRPLSSMAPTIITDDTGVIFAGGASGGSRIPSATFHVMLNVLKRGRRLGDAIADSRFHHQLVPYELRFEESMDVGFRNLLGRGVPPTNANNTLTQISNVAVCQAIIREADGGWVAGSDWRKGGLPAAF